MKSFFKIFGLIIGFNLLWSIVFFIFQPKSEIWADMGILEAFVYLLGALAGDVIYLIISFLLYLCLLFLIYFFPAVPLEIRNSSLHYEAVSPLGLHRLYSNNI